MRYVFRIELIFITILLFFVWVEGLAIYFLGAVSNLASANSIDSAFPVIVTLLICVSFYSFRVIFQATWHGYSHLKLTKLQIVSTASLFTGLVLIAFASSFQYWVFVVVILGLVHLWYLVLK